MEQKSFRASGPTLIYSGDIIRLKCEQTGKNLLSTYKKYKTGSQRYMVMIGDDDEGNDQWIIFKKDLKKDQRLIAKTLIFDGDCVLLQHNITKKLLLADPNNHVGQIKNGEVSCSDSYVSDTDIKNDFIIKFLVNYTDPLPLIGQRRIYLAPRATGIASIPLYLHNEGKKFNEKHDVVTISSGRGEDNVWIMQLQQQAANYSVPKHQIAVFEGEAKALRRLECYGIRDNEKVRIRSYATGNFLTSSKNTYKSGSKQQEVFTLAEFRGELL